MDLREAVDKLEWLRLQERDWRIRVRGSGYEHLRADIRRAAAVRESYLQMAEAALAYMEHQANPPEGGLTDTHAYFHKLAELGKAFQKAKENCNSPAGEGET